MPWKSIPKPDRPDKEPNHTSCNVLTYLRALVAGKFGDLVVVGLNLGEDRRAIGEAILRLNNRDWLRRPPAHAQRMVSGSITATALFIFFSPSCAGLFAALNQPTPSKIFCNRMESIRLFAETSRPAARQPRHQAARKRRSVRLRARCAASRSRVRASELPGGRRAIARSKASSALSGWPARISASASQRTWGTGLNLSAGAICPRPTDRPAHR